MRDLDKELTQLGASEVDILLFRPDPQRAFAAIDTALRNGADNMVRYASSLFEDPAWRPQASKQTNLHARDRNCVTCGGDRFIVGNLRKPPLTSWMMEHGILANETELIEEMKPCPDCGPKL